MDPGQIDFGGLIGFVWLRRVRLVVVGSCEHGKEPCGFIKYQKCID
jgi:hypothetical protein